MEKDLKITSARQVMTAVLSGDVDHHASGRIRRAIDEKVRELMPRRLVLDFSAVGFMDSSGVGLIIGRAALCEELGCEVSVVGARRDIRRILALSGIERISNVQVDDGVGKEEVIK